MIFENKIRQENNLNSQKELFFSTIYKTKPNIIDKARMRNDRRQFYKENRVGFIDGGFYKNYSKPRDKTTIDSNLKKYTVYNLEIPLTSFLLNRNSPLKVKNKNNSSISSITNINGTHTSSNNNNSVNSTQIHRPKAFPLLTQFQLEQQRKVTVKRKLIQRGRSNFNFETFSTNSSFIKIKDDSVSKSNSNSLMSKLKTNNCNKNYTSYLKIKDVSVNKSFKHKSVNNHYKSESEGKLLNDTKNFKTSDVVNLKKVAVLPVFTKICTRNINFHNSNSTHLTTCNSNIKNSSVKFFKETSLLNGSLINPINKNESKILLKNYQDSRITQGNGVINTKKAKNNKIALHKTKISFNFE